MFSLRIWILVPEVQFEIRNTQLNHPNPPTPSYSQHSHKRLLLLKCTHLFLISKGHMFAMCSFPWMKVTRCTSKGHLNEVNLQEIKKVAIWMIKRTLKRSACLKIKKSLCLYILRYKTIHVLVLGMLFPQPDILDATISIKVKSKWCSKFFKTGSLRWYLTLDVLSLARCLFIR